MWLVSLQVSHFGLLSIYLSLKTVSFILVVDLLLSLMDEKWFLLLTFSAAGPRRL